MAQSRAEREHPQRRVQNTSFSSPTSPTSASPSPAARHRTSTSSQPPESHSSPYMFSPEPAPAPRPPRRPRARWSVAPWPAFLQPRVALPLLAALFAAAFFAHRWLFATFDPYLMLAFYPRRRWEPPRTPPPPLHGCFAPARASPLYNVSERVFGARRTDLHAGVLLRLGVDCYDFAGTVRAPPDAPVPAPAQARTAFHSFWPARRAPFDARQEALLRSFLATQAPGSARLVVWSDRDVRGDALLQRYLAAHHDALEVRVADYALLARGTGLEGSALVKAGGAELLRLLVLWREGGVWVDMDSLLTRDLAPLLEHEFVTQWDCNYDKSRHPQTGALMRFFQHSPYLCEAFHILATSPRPRSPADWGARLYDALWPRLVAESLPAFQILPFCFSDGRAQCGLANRLPDPFARDPRGGEWMPGLGMEEGGGLDQRLQKIFAVHLHDEGSRGFPAGGWVQRLLIRRYDQSLAALEGRA